jgi:hypothetical protein
MDDCIHKSVNVNYEVAQGSDPSDPNCVRKFQCNDCGKSLSRDEVAARLAAGGDLFDAACIERKSVIKPRKFWQIHLSTAFILMIFFGIIIGANVTPHADYDWDRNARGYEYFTRGYPAPFHVWRTFTEPSGEQVVLYDKLVPYGLFMNVLTILPVVMFVAFFSELIARNREATKS